MFRRSRSSFRTGTAALVAVALFSLQAAAQGTTELEPSAPEPTTLDRVVDVAGMGIDAAIVRPLGTVAILAGGVLFVPAVALAAPAGGMEAIEEAFELFIKLPFENVFVRPLGEF